MPVDEGVHRVSTLNLVCGDGSATVLNGPPDRETDRLRSGNPVKIGDGPRRCNR